jgi:hypothetical protein
MHFSFSHKRPLWLAGHLPLLSRTWLGHHSGPSGPHDHMAIGAAFNSIDHFTILSPEVPAEQRDEAIRM